MTQFSSTSVIKAHPGNGLAVMRKLTSFLASWLLAGPRLQSSSGQMGGSVFLEPKGKQAERVSYEDPRAEAWGEAISCRSVSWYQPGLLSLVPLVNPLLHPTSDSPLV